MERRGQQEMGNNPMGYTPPQESPVKLPLAPILSTPPDHRRPNHAMLSSRRRGSSIFSPTRTLDHHHQLSLQASPDPDPTNPGASNSKNTAPQSPRPPEQEVVAATAGITNSVRYKECLKNHAASMGAHVVDGCGEFMPSGDDGTVEALKCAACDCHRNFHRKEGDGEPHFYPGSSHRSGALVLHGQTLAPSAAVPPPHLKHHFAASPTMVDFGGGAAAESSSEDLNMFQPGGHGAGQPSFSSKKRFRTKFRQDQKDRMHEFAMKLGWRIQKQDEQEVQQFCSEVGVKRQVFKVWMHNNKQAIKKRDRSD